MELTAMEPEHVITPMTIEAGDGYPPMVEGVSSIALATPLPSERVLCGSFLYYPEETAQLWSAMVAGITDPGKTLIRDDRHLCLIATLLKFLKAGRTMDIFHFVEFAGPDLVQRMGGTRYITDHGEYFWDVQINTRSHIERLIENYRVNEFQKLADFAAESSTDQKSLNSAIALINEKSLSLLKAEATSITPTADLCEDTFKSITTAEESNNEIPSAFREYSGMVGNYVRKQVRLVGAPPGRGKTAFAMQEIECALKHHFTVCAFLMESSFSQFSERYVMRNYRVKGRNFRKKFFTEKDRSSIYDGLSALAEMENRLYLAPEGQYSASQIDSILQEVKATTGRPVDFIVIDYLEKMDLDMRKGDSEWSANKRTVNQLAAITARENAAMLMLDQLRLEDIRKSFGKNNLPGLGAFRNGTAAQVAKVVMILHKDEHDMMGDTAVVEQKFVIPKANDGSSGFIRSLFLKQFAMHIEDTSTQQRAQYAAWLTDLGFDLHSTRKDR